MAAPRFTDFRSERCLALYDYWLGLARPPGSLVPLKSSFDPAAVPKLLRRLLIHDLRQPGRSILRLVGTGLVEQYGFDPTGRDYADYVEPERWPTALGELVKIAGHPCGMRVLTEYHHVGGAIHADEAVGLPLGADGGESGEGDGGFLVFLDDVLNSPRVIDPRDKPFERLKVNQRDYINIGNGVPAGSDEGTGP